MHFNLYPHRALEDSESNVEFLEGKTLALYGPQPVSTKQFHAELFEFAQGI